MEGSEALGPAAPLSGRGIDDMIKMDNLTEESILNNLRLRFAGDIIYTNTGTILVSVNPFKKIPIYTQANVREYIGRALGENTTPHIFGTAEECYQAMQNQRRNQSVIISGESGAGKTEATKLILQYLAARTNRHTMVEQKILESSPILEAFGNAKTVRNDNSSRFGKFIEIHFDATGYICGARIVNYLLERSRLVFQAEDERNYHAFYQLFLGASAEERAKYKLLDDVKQYHYLNQSGCSEVSSIDDRSDFERLKMAFFSLDISNELQDDIFTILSAILILGNITFSGSEQAAVSNPAVLATAAELLGVAPGALAGVLTTRHMDVRGQSITVNLKNEQAHDARDAIAKGIYSNLFNWIVRTINSIIYHPKQMQSFIGVLDIFGFENFRVNSFEQLCINYANEKLQQFFNQTIFKLEQQEYNKEEIEWSNIDFKDNADCIELIEDSKKMGLFAILDEECRFPKATDRSLIDKMHAQHKKHAKYEQPKRAPTNFVVRHYAGEVAYEISGFLEKNKDSLSDEVGALFNSSKIKLLRTLFVPEAVDESKAAPRAKAAGALKKPTVATNFKIQLAELMTTLGNTNPHYVRCIKPNMQKLPDVFDDDMVLAQLRYAGMMETIRIRRLGYPVRFLMDDFLWRYKVIMATNDPRQVLQLVKVSEKSAWQLGKTKVFLKDSQYKALEIKRNEVLDRSVVKIQAWWRMVWTRAYYCEYRICAVRVQAVVRGFLARKRFIVLLAAERKRKEEEEKRRRQEEERLRQERIRQEEEARRRLLEEQAKAERERRAYEEEQAKKRSAEEQARVEKERKAHEENMAALVPPVPERDDIDLEPDRPLLLPPVPEREDEPAHEIAKPKRNVAIPPPVVTSARVVPPGAIRKIARQGSAIWEDITPAMRPPLAVNAGPLDPPEPAPVASATEVEKLRPVSNKRSDPVSDLRGMSMRERRRSRTIRQPLKPEQLSFAAKVEVPELLSQQDKTRYDIEEYAKTYYQWEAKTLGRQVASLRKKKTPALPTLNESMSYSKKMTFPLHRNTNDTFVKMALNIFKLLTDFIDGRVTGYAGLQDMFVAGITNLSSFRNEIYAQIIKQSTNNPSKESTMRAWEVMGACVGLFVPNESMLKYLAAYLANAAISSQTDVAAYADYCYRRLCMTASQYSKLKRSREYPPSKLELEANREMTNIKCWIFLCSGYSTGIPIESVTAAADIFALLSIKRVHLSDPTEFAIYEVYESPNLERSLAPTDFLADIISKAEQYGDLKLMLKKKLHLDPSLLAQDAAEDRLEFYQVHMEIMKDKMPCSQNDLLFLSAIKLFIDQKSNEQAFDLQKIMPNYIPTSLLKAKPECDFAQLLKAEYDSIKNRDPKTLTDEALISDFLTRAKQLPLFGRSLFPVKLAAMDWDLPESFHIGIGVFGVEFIDSSTWNIFKILEYDSVKPGAFDSKGFTLSIEGRSKGDHRLLRFHTREGVEIVSVLEAYLFWLREDAYKGRALADYEVEDRRLLSFKQGDIIEILAKNENGWWAGRTAGKRGLFPAELVEVLLQPGEELQASGNNVKSRALVRRQSSEALLQQMRPDSAPKPSGVGQVVQPSAMRGARSSYRASIQLLIRPETYLSHMEGADSGIDYSMENYASKNFRLNKFLDARRQEAEVQRTVSHTLTPIRESVLADLPAKSVKSAVQAFQYAMQFMGDLPVEDLSPLQLMQNFVRAGIKHSKLRDELFCQLIKQTTRNPSVTSRLRGWELLSTCCGLFLPTRGLIYHLASYLNAHAQYASNERGTEADGLIDAARLASAALQRLSRLRVVGLRHHAPGKDEFAAIRIAEQIPIIVWLMDNRRETVLVDMAATISEVLQLMIRQVGLSSEAVAARNWALHTYVTTPYLAERRFGGEVGMRCQYNASICDLLSEFEAESHQKESLYFVFAESCSLEPNRPLSDPVAIHLLCAQMIAKVLNNRISVTEGEAAYLAALQFYIQTCEGNGSHESWVAKQGPKVSLSFLPDSPLLRSKRLKAEWAALIQEEFYRLDNTGKTEAEKLYLETVARWPYFASAIFLCESKQYPKVNAIAINHQGLHLFHLPEKEPILSVPYTLISYWAAARTDMLSLVMGSLMNPQRSFFSVANAEIVVDIFVTYTALIVNQRQSQKEQMQQQKREKERRRGPRLLTDITARKHTPFQI